MIGNPTKSFSRIIDGMLGFFLVVVVVIWVDAGHSGLKNLPAFLQMRLTLSNAAFAAAFTFLWVECFLTIDSLLSQSRSIVRRFLLTVGGCLMMTALVSLYLVFHHSPAPMLRILTFFLTITLFCQLLRWIATENGWLSGASQQESIIILGTGRRASKAWRELRLRYGRTVSLLGFVDDRDPAEMPLDIAQRYLCGIDDLPAYLLQNTVQRMIVATPLRSQYDMTQRAIALAESAGVQVSCMSDAFTLQHGRVNIDRSELFVNLVQPSHELRVADHVKRICDVIGAACGLILLSPLFFLIAVAIKISSAGPVFYRQERYGFNRRRFYIWKFRSMVLNADQLLAQLEERNEAQGPIFKIRKDPRITAIGRVLRTLSLDELPQLWNVLIGDMSLVGPRPMSIRDVSLFSDSILMRRFSVRPGMTGLWQVSGRSALSFDNWVALDFRYIDEWSLMLDMKILARTLPVVLKRTGAA